MRLEQQHRLGVGVICAVHKDDEVYFSAKSSISRTKLRLIQSLSSVCNRVKRVKEKMLFGRHTEHEG